jgi:hypothetical protein
MRQVPSTGVDTKGKQQSGHEQPEQAFADLVTAVVIERHEQSRDRAEERDSSYDGEECRLAHLTKTVLARRRTNGTWVSAID